MSWTGGAVSERATCVLAPNPGFMTLDGTNTWVLAEPERQARLAAAARAKAEREYTLAASAGRYTDLFAEVLQAT